MKKSETVHTKDQAIFKHNSVSIPPFDEQKQHS